MTTDQLKAAIERTLREGLPANNNGAGDVLRLEHSGSITVTVEIRGLPAVAAPGTRPEIAIASQKGVDELLRRLDAMKPVGRTYERAAPARPGRLVFQPAPWVRQMLADTPSKAV